MKQYLMIIQIYHRIVSCFFTESNSMPRLIKTLLNVSQMYAGLIITGALSLMASDFTSQSYFFITVIAMKLIQVLINYLKNANTQRAKIRNLCGLLISVALIVVSHYISILIGTNMNKRVYFNQWSFVYVGVFIFEIIIWDFILMPLIIIVLMKFGFSRLFSSKLSYVHKVPAAPKEITSIIN